jgi:hypothetical protein
MTMLSTKNIMSNNRKYKEINTAGTNIQKLYGILHYDEGVDITTLEGKEVKRAQFTLQQIKDLFEDNKFDFPEEYQRGQVTTWRSFGRQWVTTLFSQDGFEHFDKLHFREIRKKNSSSIRYQVVEGGQRLRAINDFFFKHAKEYRFHEGFYVKTDSGTILNLGGFTWDKLLSLSEYDVELDRYLTKVLSRAFDVSVYRNYTLSEIADIFCKINKKTPLNDQELRTAIGGECSYAIRKLARHDAEPCKFGTYKLHKMFEVYESKTGYRGCWMGIKPARYEFEATLSTFMLFEETYATNNVFNVNNDNLRKMYERHSYTEYGDRNDPELLQDDIKIEEFKNATKPLVKLINKVLSRFDTIHQMVDVCGFTHNSKQILTKGNLFVLYGILYHIDTYFPEYNVSYDARKFYMWFWKKHIAMCKTVEAGTGKVVESNYSLKARKASREKSEIEELFSYWKNIFNTITENEIADAGIILKDKKRVISDVEAQTLYAQQNGKDIITGQDMPLEILQKGHIVAHSKGGHSTIENSVLINKFDNNRQGALEFDDFFDTSTPEEDEDEDVNEEELQEEQK